MKERKNLKSILQVTINFHLFATAMTHLVQQFEEFQWRLEWLRQPLQVANMQVANGVWEAGLRPPQDYNVQFFQTNADGPDSVAWMSVECGHPCWSTVTKMVVPEISIGTNWRKTSGRRAKALAAAGVWHSCEKEDLPLQRCMWSLHRCSYLLYVLVVMSDLCQNGDEIADIKSCDDLWALIEERLRSTTGVAPTRPTV